MQVGSIHIHPIKATAPVGLTHSKVDLAGLRDDRRWAVVDPFGSRLNATTHDLLLTVTATPHTDGALTLTRSGSAPLHVRVPHDGEEVAVNVSRLPTMIDAGDEPAAWLGAVLGESVRLVWQDDPGRRPISNLHGGRGAEPMNLADAGPLLVATSASLAQLDAWIAEDHEAEPMVMSRFRPNIVIDGSATPFVEDHWRHIHIGEVAFRFAEHCDRCVVTTIDPVTLAHGKEPIRALARHRRWDGKTWFGIRVVPLETGTVSVGDPVIAS
ncbi:MOSC domain-containing protein [Aeromicrobium sp.]|uniref:MOSC domain-containing protein n=1 Tax=Aeromicrobium sp. TaxID=1871063 RepID=UPI003C67F394